MNWNLGRRLGPPIASFADTDLVYTQRDGRMRWDAAVVRTSRVFSVAVTPHKPTCRYLLQATFKSPQKQMRIQVKEEVTSR